MWSHFILFACGFNLEVEIEGELDKSKAYIICPNHVSYIDIPVTFAAMPGVFVFVGKKSLSKIPLKSLDKFVLSLNLKTNKNLSSSSTLLTISPHLLLTLHERE